MFHIVDTQLHAAHSPSCSLPHGPAGVILSAKSVEDLLHRLQDGDRAARRGQQLYRFLEANMESLAPNRPGADLHTERCLLSCPVHAPSLT